MKIQDLFCNIYDLLGSSYSRDLRSVARLCVRVTANKLIAFSYKYISVHRYEEDTNSDVIVSLTSFPARIGNLWIVIETILRQTVRPGKIVLWLSIEQFQDLSRVPDSLLQLCPYGLDVRLVPNDYRSHKKYLYAFEELKNKKVVLIDDDIIYHSTLIENLLNRYAQEDKPTVVATYGYEMKYSSDGTLLPYNNWEWLNKDSSSKSIFFGSGGGTLFTPSTLYKDVTDIDKALTLTPSADDIWLNAMARLGENRIVMVKPWVILPILNKENITLCSSNVCKSQNDIQIENVRNYYIEKMGKDPFKNINHE